MASAQRSQVDSASLRSISRTTVNRPCPSRSASSQNTNTVKPVPSRPGQEPPLTPPPSFATNANEKTYLTARIRRGSRDRAGLRRDHPRDRLHDLSIRSVEVSLHPSNRFMERGAPDFRGRCGDGDE